MRSPRFADDEAHVAHHQVGTTLALPTRGAAAVAILAALLLFIAMNLQAGWVFAVDALLLGLLVIGFANTELAGRGLVIRRQMPPEAFEGDRVSITLALEAARWPQFLTEIKDAVPGLDPHLGWIPVLLPHRSATIAYTTQVRRRGVHRIDAVEVRSGGLTGLFAIRRRVAAAGTLMAFPRYWPLARFPLPGRNDPERGRSAQPARTGLDVASVRDFRYGDSLRHVHWRSTARRGTLVVREFEREVPPAAILLLDTRAEGHVGDDGDSPFEDLVRAAASIAHFITSAGRSVRIVASRGTHAESGVGWQEVLEMLARVDADGRLSPIDLYAAAALPAGTPVVVLSSDSEGVVALVRAGISVVAVLVDGESYRRHSTGVEAADGALRALHVPVCVLRRGEEIPSCLESCA